MSFIDANEISLQKFLFQPTEIFKLPLYQRPYAWTKDQWADLLEDILSLTENDIHFFGAIVVVPTQEATQGLKSFYVIDGQQRLATILIWLSAIRDKLALTALIYYLHPNHLGGKPLVVKGCFKCKNKKYKEPLTENNCSFGGLMNYLRQEKVNDPLYKKLKEIETDKDIQWIVSKRNNILHRISEYRWKGLGIFPESLDIKYEDGKEIAKWNLGSSGDSLLKEVSKLESSYNKFVSYVEELELILFPIEG